MSFETLVHSTDRINPYAKRIHGIGTGEPRRRAARGAGAGALPPLLQGRGARRAQRRRLRHPADRQHHGDGDRRRQPRHQPHGRRCIWDLRDTIGLERMCRELGVHHRRPHHALADAEATAACFIELLKLGRERFGWRTLGDLLAVAQPPPPRINDGPRGRRRGAAAPAGDRGGRAPGAGIAAAAATAAAAGAGSATARRQPRPPAAG